MTLTPPPKTQTGKRRVLLTRFFVRLNVVAAAFGYLLWLGCAVGVGIGVYDAMRGWRWSGDIPFERGDGMTGNHLVADHESSRHLLSGDGMTCQAWNLTGSSFQLRQAVLNRVRNGLLWQHRPFDARDKQVLDLVNSSPEFAAVQSSVADIQKDGDFYFAYEHLRIDDGERVGRVGVYLFSPSRMLLVYLDYDT